MIKQIIEEFIEVGANLEHDRWARWQTYLHSLCKKNKDGSLIIPKERVNWWEKEINTPYSKLSEKLKEWDRIETKNYIPLLEKALAQQKKEIVEIIEEMKDNTLNETKLYSGEHGSILSNYSGKKAGYNQALDDILEKLTNK